MEKTESKKTLVVSAINLHEGGTLAVLTDCLRAINDSPIRHSYRIFALVHDAGLFDTDSLSSVLFISFPKSRKSYFYRLYYEYVYFRKFAAKHAVNFWLSLHDITPRLRGVPRAVYCHNPAPFRKASLKDLKGQPTVFFFTLFYKYLYRINIHRNEYVIVQQEWLRNAFSTIFNLDRAKIIVATPPIPNRQSVKSSGSSVPIFVFPTLARPFKNIEVIGEAVRLLNDKGLKDFSVVITIDGTENTYARQIVNQYSRLPQLYFIGKISREQVYQYYSESTALIFPSKLETWGMPLTEYKGYGKPILASGLPYARETMGEYDKVKFFAPDNATELAESMRQLVTGEPMDFDKTSQIDYLPPFAPDWQSLFSILLGQNSIVQDEHKAS